MASVRHRLPADVLLLVTVLFWSFNFTVVKYALTHGWEPLAYSSMRFAIGAVIFSAFTYAREHTLRVARGDVRFMIVVAALGIWLNQLTFAYAVRLTTAATVALMFGTLPIFVALVAQAFGLERLPPRHWIATAVSFSGVALVAAGASSGLSGDLGGILARPRRLGHLGGVLGRDGAAHAALLALPDQRLHADRGSIPLLVSSVKQLAEQDWGAIGGLAWACFVYSLFFSLVFTNIMWFTAIDRVGRRPRVALREPAAVPRRLLRAGRPLGGDGPAPVRRRHRHRRRHPHRALRSAPCALARLSFSTLIGVSREVGPRLQGNQ